MHRTRRRRSAILTLLGLLLGSVSVLLSAAPARAGSSSNTNACFTAATATYGEVAISVTGNATPDPVTFPNPVTLAGTSFEGTFSAALFIAAYRLNILNNGSNPVSAIIDATINASNTSQGSRTQSIATTLTVVIDDPTPANRSSGDETANPLVINRTLANSTWTPTGGAIVFTQSTFTVRAAVGALAVTLGPCLPSSGLTGCVGGSNCTGFTQNPSPIPFETVIVNGGPTATTSTTVVTTSTTTTTLPANACAGAKLKAAGKKAVCLLNVQAKAAKRGQPVEADKVQRCKDKFSKAFARAEANPPCLTNGDTGDIEDKVDLFVDDVTNDLVP